MTLRILKLAEAHRQTGIPVKTLRKLIDQGKLAGNRIGRDYIVSEDSLRAFVQHTTETKTRSTDRFTDIAPEDRWA